MYCQKCGLAMRKLEGDVNYDGVCPGCDNKSRVPNEDREDTLEDMAETLKKLETKLDDIHTIVSGLGT